MTTSARLLYDRDGKAIGGTNIPLPAAEPRPEKYHDLPSARDYWLGRVVSKKQDDHRIYGHIVGFKRTNVGEVGIVVMWEGGDEDMIHHANIDLH